MIRKFNAVLFAISLCSFLFTGCGKPKVKPIDPTTITWERYALDKKEAVLSIEIPKDAQKFKNIQPQMSLYAFATAIAMKKVIFSIISAPIDEYALKNFGPDKILDEQRNLVDKQGGIKILKEEKIKDAWGNTGRLIKSTKDAMFMNFRMFAVKNRIYVYSFGAPQEDESLFRDIEERFFDSILLKN